MATTVAVIVAAGRGTRAAAGHGIPKQYASLGGEPVLAHSLRVLAGHPQVDRIGVVIHPDDRPLYAAAARPFAACLDEPVPGGATRQDSVRAGLEALAGHTPDRVLIHDAARPFLTADLVSRLLAALDETPAAIAAEPVADTLKRAAADGTIAQTVERAGLWRAQTPQAFRFAPILAAHRDAAKAGQHGFTDDAGLAEWAGLAVKLVASTGSNIKLTTAADMALAERLLGAASATHRGAHRQRLRRACVRAGRSRVAVRGQGSRTRIASRATRTPTWRCTRSPTPSSARSARATSASTFRRAMRKWRGAPSRIFLEDAARRVAARKGRIANVDVTVLCEAPKIGPHRDAMRAAIAGMLGIDASRVNVKATTTEGLGFVGRGEGIAALASATILLPV